MHMITHWIEINESVLLKFSNFILTQYYAFECIEYYECAEYECNMKSMNEIYSSKDGLWKSNLYQVLRVHHLVVISVS